MTDRQPPNDRFVLHRLDPLFDGKALQATLGLLGLGAAGLTLGTSEGMIGGEAIAAAGTGGVFAREAAGMAAKTGMSFGRAAMWANEALYMGINAYDLSRIYNSHMAQARVSPEAAAQLGSGIRDTLTGYGILNRELSRHYPDHELTARFKAKGIELPDIADIQSARRLIAKKVHEDIGGAKILAQEVNAACDRLQKSETRNAYEAALGDIRRSKDLREVAETIYDFGVSTEWEKLAKAPPGRFEAYASRLGGEFAAQPQARQAATVFATVGGVGLGAYAAPKALDEWRQASHAEDPATRRAHRRAAAGWAATAATSLGSAGYALYTLHSARIEPRPAGRAALLLEGHSPCR